MDVRLPALYSMLTGPQGVKGRLYGVCKKAKRGGKLSGGSRKGGLAGKDVKQVRPPSELQKLKIVTEVHE